MFNLEKRKAFKGTLKELTAVTERNREWDPGSWSLVKERALITGPPGCLQKSGAAGKECKI